MQFFQESIFRVIAAILHLGNINFAKGEEIDSSVIKDEKSRFHLYMTAELLRHVSSTFPFPYLCLFFRLNFHTKHCIDVMPRAWKMP